MWDDSYIMCHTVVWTPVCGVPASELLAESVSLTSGDISMEVGFLPRSLDGVTLTEAVPGEAYH